MKLGKLKRKIAILKKAEAVETERTKLQAEYAGLKHKEKSKVFVMKHKKKIAVVRTVAVGAKRIGRGLGIMAKGIIKGARESEGLKNQYEAMYGKQPRRKVVAIVKKKKKKR